MWTEEETYKQKPILAKFYNSGDEDKTPETSRENKRGHLQKIGIKNGIQFLHGNPRSWKWMEQRLLQSE